MPSKLRDSFSFIKNFRWFGLISLVLVAAGVVSLLLLPFGVTLFNMDIDFLGGTEMTFEMRTVMTRAELDKVASIVEEVTGVAPTPPQQLGGANGTQVYIRTLSISPEKRAEVFETLKKEYNLQDEDNVRSRDVGTSVGKDMQRAAVIATLVAALGILLYITIRFTFISGLAAVLSLIHDLLVTVSVYVIFQIPLNMNFVAVMLTILGYSINSAIIVFDRIRENRRIMTKTKFSVVVDKSIWQTVARNINTTLTTLLPIIMLIILGVSSVRNFVIPLGVGLVAGAYSSICLAAPLWNKFTKDA